MCITTTEYNVCLVIIGSVLLEIQQINYSTIYYNVLGQTIPFIHDLIIGNVCITTIEYIVCLIIIQSVLLQIQQINYSTIYCNVLDQTIPFIHINHLSISQYSFKRSTLVHICFQCTVQTTTLKIILSVGNTKCEPQHYLSTRVR